MDVEKPFGSLRPAIGAIIFSSKAICASIQHFWAELPIRDLDGTGAARTKERHGPAHGKLVD
jgi:hypothetical protein